MKQIKSECAKLQDDKASFQGLGSHVHGRRGLGSVCPSLFSSLLRMVTKWFPLPLSMPTFILKTHLRMRSVVIVKNPLQISHANEEIETRTRIQVLNTSKG